MNEIFKIGEMGDGTPSSGLWCHREGFADPGILYWNFSASINFLISGKCSILWLGIGENIVFFFFQIGKEQCEGAMKEKLHDALTADSFSDPSTF